MTSKCLYFNSCLVEKREGCSQPIGCAVYQTIDNIQSIRHARQVYLLSEACKLLEVSEPNAPITEKLEEYLNEN